MNQKCMIWLQRQLRNKKIALEHCEKRGDDGAAVNLREKIAIIEHLIDLINMERNVSA